MQPHDRDLAPVEHDKFMPASEAVSRGHEEPGVNFRGVVLTTIALLLLMILPMIAVGVYLAANAPDDAGATGTAAPTAWDDPALPDEPSLFTNQPGELRALRAQEQERLNSSGWVDQPEGIAHIPIEQAMQLIVEQGLPRWQAEEAEELPSDEQHTEEQPPAGQDSSSTAPESATGASEAPP